MKKVIVPGGGGFIGSLTCVELAAAVHEFVSGLTKTRSGKIMRRILRKVAEGETGDLGDTSTLLDPAVVEEIKKGAV